MLISTTSVELGAVSGAIHELSQFRGVNQFIVQPSPYKADASRRWDVSTSVDSPELNYFRVHCFIFPSSYLAAGALL